MITYICYHHHYKDIYSLWMMIYCFIPLYLIIGIQTLNKLIEQYKNKAIELETSSFELQSSLQTKEQIIIQLNNEIERNKNNKNIFIDEINSLKLQIQHYEVQASLLNDDNNNNNTDKNSNDVNDSGSGDLNDKNYDNNNHNYQFIDKIDNETMENLKLKIKMLERELKISKSSVLSTNDKNDVNSSSVGSNNDGDNNRKYNDGADNRNNHHNDEIMMLKNELNDVRHIKREREDMLLQSKKYIEELRYEIEKLKEQYHQQVTSHTNTSSSTTNTTTSSSNDNNDNKNIIIIKELNQKLSETFNTIKLLQDKLKEKESNINKLEQEKNKLENYTKRSLHTFKEKYMNVLHILKEEKEELQLKLKLQIEKTEKNNITWLKEEKLISSAMFELGVCMMDQQLQSQLSGHNISNSISNSSSSNNNRNKNSVGDNMMFSSPPHQSSSSSSSNFLDLQRDALERSITDSILNTTITSPSNNLINNNNISNSLNNSVNINMNDNNSNSISSSSSSSNNSSSNMNVIVNANSNSANYRSPMINPLRINNNNNILNNNNNISSTSSSSGSSKK